MNIIIGAKLAAELCFLYSVLCFFPGFQGEYSYMLLLMALSVISIFLSGKLQEKGILRFLFALLPLGTFGLAWNTRQYVLLVAVIVYLLFVAWKKAYHIVYWMYVPIFKLSLLLVVIILVVADQRKGNHMDSVIFILSYVLLASYVMRMERLSLQMDTKAKLLDLVSLGLLGGVCSAVGAFVYGITHLKYDFLVDYVFTPIAYALYKVIDAVIYFFNQFTRVTKLDSTEIIENLNNPGDNNFNIENWEENVSAVGDSSANIFDVHQVLRFLLILLILMALGAFVFVVIKSTKKDRREGLDSVTYEYAGRKKKKKVETGGNKGRARKIYRDYIKNLKKRGYRRRKSDSSEEVLAESWRFLHGAELQEENRRFRELYLKARYDETGEMTSEEMKEMKALWNRIRSDK